MNPILAGSLFTGIMWKTLAAALLHTLWQGAVILAVLALLLKLIPAKHPQLRYTLACLAMAAVLLCGLTTWAILEQTTTHAASAMNSHFRASTPLDSGNSIATTNDETEPSFGETAPSLSASSGTDTREGNPFIHSLMITIWLFGVALMLLRNLCQLRDSAGLRTNGRIPENHDLLRIFESLKRSMQIRGRATLLLSNKLSSPAALGAIEPIVLLPVAFVTGASTVMIRAALAHELAHIRRHDYFVNLAQLVVETVLFFNPAVWWVSRQIRIEREACCDAIAAAATGNETNYAEALSAFAEQSMIPADLHGSNIPASALGLGDESRSGPLLDRVKRLLVPDYRSSLRLPWMGLTIFLLGGGLGLFALQQGTLVMVEKTAQLLSPTERIEKIHEIRQKQAQTNPSLFGSWDSEELSKQENFVPITVTARMEDGSPVPKKLKYVGATSTRPSYTGSYSLIRKANNRYEYRVAPGNIYVSAILDGWAPALAGPFAGVLGTNFHDIEIVFEKGFSHPIHIRSTTGEPITNAKLNGRYNFANWTPIPDLFSDIQGIVTISNALEMAVELDLYAPGYQHERREIKLTPQADNEWIMRKAQPTTVRVISEQTGEPIPGAQLRLRKINGPDSIDYSSGTDRLQAQAGKDGTITLDQLRDDSHYWFFLDAPGHRRHLLSNVHADGDLTVKLGPDLYISGEIHGDLEKLARRKVNGKKSPYISISNPYMLEGNSYSSPVWTPVTIRDGKGYFRFTNLWEGVVRFGANVDQSKLDLYEPIEDLILNIVSQKSSEGEELRRELEIRIASPSDHPPVNGILRVTEYKSEGASYVYTNHKNISITNGVARTKVLVSGKFHYRAEDIPGFWLPESKSQIIDEGETPFIVEAKAEPAGAIYGSIREEDGSPAESVLISVVEVKRAPERHQGSLDVRIKNSSSDSGDFIESFIAPSLPLGGEYAIVVHRGDSYATTKALPINTTQPLQQVSIVMPAGKNLNGMVTTRDGSPAAGVKYSLNFSTSYSHGFSREERLTGRDGGILLTGINPDAHGTYYLNFEENSGYQRLNMELDPRNPQFNVVLDSASNLTGRVVEDTSGQPIQGAEVYVLPHPILRIQGGHVNADAKTDNQGRFQFTTLDDGEYELHIRGGNILPKDKEHIVRGGQRKEPNLRVKLSK